MAVDTGHGATIAFATTGGTWLCKKITGLEETTPIVNKSHLATATREATMPGDLRARNQVTATILFQGSQGLPAHGTTTETVTITHPTAAGNTTPANLAGTAFIHRTKYPDFETNTMQEGEISIEYDGATLTYTAAS